MTDSRAFGYVYGAGEGKHKFYAIKTEKAVSILILTRKAPNTTRAEFANTVDPDEKAHYEPSHLDLQCLPSSL